MILLNKCGKITVDNNKTNITFPFEIKDNFKSIKIKFEYAPKTLEDRAKSVQIIKSCLEKYGEDEEFNIESYLPVKILLHYHLIQAGNISAQFTGKAISRNLLFPLIIHHRAFLKRI